ncbi:MAG: replication initiation factor domain-containing protein [Dehalococcoidales bacterium]
MHGECRAPSPPYLLGGDNCQKQDFDLENFSGSVGVDWLQGTVPFEKSALLFDYFSKMCGGKPEVFTYGYFCYDRHCKWHPYGIAMYWDSDQEKRNMHRNRVAVQLSGQSLGAFSANGLFRLMRDLNETFEFSTTRIDLCFNDFEKIKMPHDVAKIAEQSNFTGFKCWEPKQKRRVSGEFLNDGIYFGQRGKNGSGRYLRCYDKNLESKGEMDCVRWEVEFTKQTAKTIFLELCSAPDLETFAGMIGAIIGGSIDFVNRKGTHLDRMERLDWWQRIVDILGCVKLRNPQRIKSIDNTKEWLEKAVVSSMKKVQVAVGGENFESWLEPLMRNAKLSKRHRAEIRDYHDKYGISKGMLKQSALVI